MTDQGLAHAAGAPRGSAPRDRLAALRLLVITDGQGCAARLEQQIREILAGGICAVQLREPGLSARALGALCDRLRPWFDAAGGLLLVNDRVDVAAACAHGAQVGHRSLAPAQARRLLLAGQVLGSSAHDERELAAARAAHCDFALLSPVFATASKPGAVPLGQERAAALTAAAGLPVVWLGGLDAVRIAALRFATVRPIGFAVRGAVAAARDVAAQSRALVEAGARALA